MNTIEKRIKKTFICTDVKQYAIDTAVALHYIPEAGDVAVFEVMTIGKHKQVQSDSKRNTLIMPGDLIMAAFGTRYATAQFEGYLPDRCLQEYHILGAGGTIGIIRTVHSRFSEVGPTVLKMIGYAVDEQGNVINTKKLKADRMQRFSGNTSLLCNIILSVGASMDSGKTTTAGYMVRGLKAKGKKVAFIKLTGTVYTKDKDFVYDMGADVAVDFADFGFPSTYMCSEQELLDLYDTLMGRAIASGADYIVMEIADGIYQRETKMLLQNKQFMSLIDTIVFSCADSLSAIQGVQLLDALGIRPAILSGLFTASPLLIKEVSDNSRVPALTIDQLAAGEWLSLVERSLLQNATV